MSQNIPERFYEFQTEMSQQNDAADQNFDYMFKLLIIGNSAVGKTSFLFRLVSGCPFDLPSELSIYINTNIIKICR